VFNADQQLVISRIVIFNQKPNELDAPLAADTLKSGTIFKSNTDTRGTKLVFNMETPGITFIQAKIN